MVSPRQERISEEEDNRRGLSSPKRSSRKRLNSSESPSRSSELREALKFHNFVGISLTGGKTNKTCLTHLAYYPKQKKIFLKEINEKIKATDKESSDLILYNLISGIEKPLEYVAFDVPLQLPKCIRCKLKCPGYEVCSESEMKWLRKNYFLKNKKAKTLKILTPYTERCVEAYMASELEEIFHPSHALGSNAAPLTARALYISRRLNVKCVEVFPKLSLWRIGNSLNIQKSYLRFHKHSVDGEEIRAAILQQLINKSLVFIYAQDIKILVSNSFAFDAFLCGLTAVLKYQNQVDKRPKGFPPDESWIEMPKVNLTWT